MTLAAAWDLALVLTLLAAACGIGAPILGGWQASGVHAIERFLFGTVLGLGLLAIGVTVLGALGFLGVVPLAAFLMGGIAVGWKGLRNAPAAFRDLAGVFREAGPIAGAVSGTVLTLVAGTLVVGALTPVTDWDSLMYHLQIPARFLESGRIHLPEDNLHAAFLGLIHMLYLPLLALGGMAGPGLLSVALALLLGVAVVSAGTRLFGPVSGVCSATLLWGSGMLVMVAATPRVDVSLALFLFLAHYALILQLQNRVRNTGGLVVAAALAGIALGVKYQALAYVGPLLLLGLWTILRDRSPTRDRLKVVGACTAIFALGATPMLLKNLVLLGSPFYPFLAERVVPPWLAAITGSTGVPPGVGPETFGLVAQAREPFNLLDAFLRPEALTVEAEAVAFTTNPAFLLLPLALLFWRDRTLMALLLVPALYLTMILVPFEFTNLRYLIPVIPAFTLVSVEVSRRLLERVTATRRATLLLVIGSVAAILPAAQAVGERLLTPDRLQAAAGVLPAQDYLALDPVPGFAAYWNARTRVHESTGPDARILFLFEARGLYFERNVLQDNALTNWPLLRATHATDTCLEGTGITHILLNLGALGFYQSRGMDTGPLGLDAFQEFNRCLEPIFNEAGYVFFRVRSAPGSPPPPPV